MGNGTNITLNRQVNLKGGPGSGPRKGQGKKKESSKASFNIDKLNGSEENAFSGEEGENQDKALVEFLNEENRDGDAYVDFSDEAKKFVNSRKITKQGKWSHLPE